MAVFDHRLAAPAAAFALAGCTLGGLGDYEVKTCARPAAVQPIQQVGASGATRDVGFTSASGAGTVAAFVADVTGGACVQGVAANGYLDPSCSFMSDERTRVPRQPAVVALGAGHAAALLATTAPCTTGKLLYRFTAPGVAGGAEPSDCAAEGAALPAVAPVSNGARAIVAWYGTTFATRADPIAACASATPAPLHVAGVTKAADASPSLGPPATLGNGISVRAPSLVAAPDGASVLLASPAGDDAAIWSISADGVASPPLQVPGLAGARAVTLALAADGSSRVALVAEIGCTPQSIRLAVGTLAAGLATIAEVAPQGGDAAVQPTVAWVPSRGEWLVGWISASGSAHVLARRFSADGQPLGDVIDRGVPATAASATSDGDLIAFAPQGNASSFLDVVLGCAP